MSWRGRRKRDKVNAGDQTLNVQRSMLNAQVTKFIFRIRKGRLLSVERSELSVERPRFEALLAIGWGSVIMTA